jgi:hypothetical protein
VADKGLSIDYQPIGRNGRVRLTARFADGSTHTDKVDVAEANGRARFLRSVCKGRKGIDRKTLAAKLNAIADEIIPKACANESTEGRSGGRGRASQAEVLLALTVGIELFHSPGSYDSEPYASIRINDHTETWPVNSKGFRRWLSMLFYQESERAPSGETLQDVLNVLGGKAIHAGAEHPVAVRVAERDGFIYVDLADTEWRAVRIGPDGWMVVGDSPVKFTRRRGMLALPEPVPGGHVDELRSLANLPDDDAWMLSLAWLIAAFRPNRPFPVLNLTGEQGSGKSTWGKMLRALIDPNSAPLRRPPRDERDLAIAAGNAWVVAYDNLSGIPPWLSDALCCISTGGGFGTRELYSDDEEKLFDAMRPAMVNGIEDVATRGDLLDRSINLTLPEIRESARREERDLWKTFEQSRPRILGALLDAVSTALRHHSGVRLDCKPRMADFATWVAAAEPALDWSPGAFLSAYLQNRGAADALALEAAIIAHPVIDFMRSRQFWTGTAAELLGELDHLADDRTRRRKEWPSGPRKLAGDMRRVAPHLRKSEIDVTFDREAGGRRRRLIRLERCCNAPSQPSQSARDTENTPSDAGRSRDDRDNTADSEPTHRPSRNSAFSALGTMRDGRDDVLHECSNVPENDVNEEVLKWTV